LVFFVMWMIRGAQCHFHVESMWCSCSAYFVCLTVVIQFSLVCGGFGYKMSITCEFLTTFVGLHAIPSYLNIYA
jgi:hypothetical protein